MQEARYILVTTCDQYRIRANGRASSLETVLARYLVGGISESWDREEKAPLIIRKSELGDTFLSHLTFKRLHSAQFFAFEL